MERADRSLDPALLGAEPVRYGPDALADMARACEAAPDREACGFVIARGAALAVVEVPNVADDLHAQDPVAFPRTSRDSYVMDARAQLRVLRAAEESGARIVAVWHSHVEAGAWFSEKDRADALLDGRPVLPGVEYLVFGLRGGRVTERRTYRLIDGAWVASETR